MPADLVHEGLRLHVTEDADEVRVHWVGESDMRNPSKWLQPFLMSLAESLEGREVTLDFRDCRYMNSASLAPIIRFMKELDDRDARGVLHFDETWEWQRLTARSLRAFARRLTGLTVRTNGP